MIGFVASDVFLVTGASAGIGASLARLLVELGASVIGVGRNEERLAAVKTSCSAPDRFHPETRDLAVDLEDLPELKGWFRREFGAEVVRASRESNESDDDKPAATPRAGRRGRGRGRRSKSGRTAGSDTSGEAGKNS